MRQTLVPAQVITVEDRIAGNLTLTQLLLLAAPVFSDLGIYVLFLPFMRFSFLKLFVCISSNLFCWLMAIRLRGRIILEWSFLLARYNHRPGLYVFNKNSDYLRKFSDSRYRNDEAQKSQIVESGSSRKGTISKKDEIAARNFIDDPNFNLSFQLNKGAKLYVHLKKAE